MLHQKTEQCVIRLLACPHNTSPSWFSQHVRVPHREGRMSHWTSVNCSDRKSKKYVKHTFTLKGFKMDQMTKCHQKEEGLTVSLKMILLRKSHMLIEFEVTTYIERYVKVKEIQTGKGVLFSFLWGIFDKAHPHSQSTIRSHIVVFLLNVN